MTPPRASLRDRLLAELQAIESRPLHWLPTPQTIALLREAADALPEGWQPIETAPKDGTDIMLGAPEQIYRGAAVSPRTTIGHWTTDEECRTQIGDCGGECRCPEYEYGEPYWLSWDGGFTNEDPPTHWQPLPASPTPGDSDGG